MFSINIEITDINDSIHKYKYDTKELYMNDILQHVPISNTKELYIVISENEELHSYIGSTCPCLNINSLTFTNAYAFLRKITIKSTTSCLRIAINNNAIYKMNNLKEFILDTVNPPVLHPHMFTSCNTDLVFKYKPL